MVRTRIAPSPTGFPHIGTIFQALINYAIAKNAKPEGQFIVRIEDTDQKRKVEGAEDAIFDALSWFGILPDESPVHGGAYGPYRQSEKLPRYQERAQWLVDEGKAYYCFCTPEELDAMRKKQQQKKKPPMYDGKCRSIPKDEAKKRAEKESHVVRMKVVTDKPVITVHDDIRGDIEFGKDVIDDQVILKSDGFPTYHLAVVVDDHDMEITHIIRGEEWISSMPKHVLLYQYFGWSPPSFGSVNNGFRVLHTPLLRNVDGSKLSKRHSHAAVSWYKKQGFLPEALLNYLANLVYEHPKGEIYSIDEFIKSFDRTKMHSVGARFDIAKLKWINGEWIRDSSKISDEDLADRILSIETDRGNKIVEKKTVLATIPLVRERMKTLAEYWPLCAFLFELPKEYDREINREWLGKVVKGFEEISKWSHEEIYKKGSEIAEEIGVSKSKLFMDIRIAIAGKKVGPPLFESMEILGKEESLKRVRIIQET